MPSLKSVVSAKFNIMDFPDSQYIKEVVKKRQIVLHHTASGRGVDGDYRHWLGTKERIATCVIIDSNGDINQMFSSHFWAYHLGLRTDFLRKFKGHMESVTLEKMSIGIEIDAWGGLKKIGKNWVAYPNNYGSTGKATIVPDEEVIEYPKLFRGYCGFQKYTDKQIETTRQLLNWWSITHEIPMIYNDDIWDVSPRAIRGEKGIFTHCSYRADKSDVHPQPELIKMLKSLE